MVILSVLTASWSICCVTFVDPAQSNWADLLPLEEFAINDSYHESVLNTPFMLDYGKRPHLPVLLILRGKEPNAQSTATCDAADDMSSSQIAFMLL